jgi:DNA repair exonuclease SbcCD ATPase subunit
MKLESIDLRNFLSHEATHWEPNGARLATIVGPNGAGKSALLDGLLYTLYDAARGRTDELVRLGTSDMAAEVTFAFAGARYRVTRGRTTRSGGKSYLELAIAQADGSWRPLTADSIRETQAAIEALLRLDAATFTTAAFLRQGDADAFISATAAERKRILGSVLGLDVYAAAEARARDRARTLDGEAAAMSRAIDALDVALAHRPELEAAAAAAKAEEEATVAAMEAAGRRRDAAEEAMRSLSGRLAEAKAAQEELARIDADLAALRDRYRRAREGADAARAAILRTKAAAEADVPEHNVAAAEAEFERVDALVMGFVPDGKRLQAELSKAQSALMMVEEPFRKKSNQWWRDDAGARAAVRLGEELANGLQPVTCPRCRHMFDADPGDIAGQLDAARASLLAVGPEPPEPLDIARLRAAITRTEIALREARDPDAAAEVALRSEFRAAGELAAAARAAAAALTARDGARVALVDAQAALGRAEAELAEIDATGKAVAITRTKALERSAGAGKVAEDLVAADTERRAAIAAATDAARRHAAAIAADAEARGALIRLERDQVERDRIVGGVARAEAQLGRLRRLAAAFGVGGIPARIIESVLPELASYAQELLDQLRPGMALSIRAQRAKRDGKGIVEALDLIVRDDVGERPLALFSGGERMSVSLALAVGLSRLVARRAGTAIRTLVIDEPDGLDADARRAFGLALRVLAHHGELERVVVVSHHEDLAEVGDAVYRVSKGPGGSVIEQIS